MLSNRLSFLVIFNFAKTVNANVNHYRDDDFYKSHMIGGTLKEGFLKSKKFNIDIFMFALPINVDTEHCFELTAPITSIYTFWLLPQRKQLETWTKIIYVFPLNTWAAVLVFMILLTVTWTGFLLINNQKNTSILKTAAETLFFNFTLLVNVSTLIIPKTLHARLLLLFCLLYSLHLACFYNASLSSSLTTPR